MIRSILFDFGGTLDTNGIHWSEKYWEIYQRIGVPIKKADFEKAFIISEAEIKSGVIGRDCLYSDTLRIQVEHQIAFLVRNGAIIETDDSNKTAGNIARECFRDVCQNTLWVKVILAELSKNYSLGLVSNFYGNLENVCRELDILRYFATLVDSTLVGFSKPEPQIFSMALEILGVKPEECLMVGDSYDRDIVPAKSIGCVTVWLHGRSWKEPQTIEKADYCINSLAQLPSLMRKINPGC
jgi:FMN phosphatase YigB (HAD superfamily)